MFVRARAILEVLVVLCARVLAQGSGSVEPTVGSYEQPLAKMAATEIHAFAQECFAGGFPCRARDLWLELLLEYDEDHAEARAKLGFVRAGAAWRPDPEFPYPESDEPDLKAAKLLEARWQSVCKKLGDGHRELASRLQAAGDEPRARRHFGRSLRFLQADPAALAALGAKTVEGVTGTELELTLLRRSRKLERAVARLSITPYPVAKAAVTDPRLDAAGARYEAWSSERFVVFGDWEPETMSEVAQWCERALAFCQEAFEGSAPWKIAPELCTRFAFFKDRAKWVEVVKANASAVQDVDFILEHSSACPIGYGAGGILVACQQDPAVLNDYAVRKVAEQWSLSTSHAVTEGMGHAIVGMFFGKNLLMTLAQQRNRSGTVSRRKKARADSPDLELWREIARELAYERAAAPAARLPRIHASDFSAEERIKSWSFCDYLLRRDPSLLVPFDGAGARANNDIEVMAAFEAAARIPLPSVEDDWRAFCVGDSAALRAIRERTTPMDAVSKDAAAWLEEWNRVRVSLGAPAVGWSADWSAACRQHAEYLKQNKVGSEDEHDQDPKKPLSSNPGRLFAQTALVWTGDRDPRKGLASWLMLPGYRDALLDPNLDQIGLYADGQIVVADIQRGRGAKDRVDLLVYPPPMPSGTSAPKVTFPSSVPVALLGKEARAALQAAGRGKQKEVGLPISLHGFGVAPQDVACIVTAGGKPVAGRLVLASKGPRRTTAAGMWVFYPQDPLPKGRIQVKWTGKGLSDEFLFDVGG